MRGTNKLTVNDATLHEMLTSYLNEYVFTSNDQIVKVTDVSYNTPSYGGPQTTITFETVTEDKTE